MTTSLTFEAHLAAVEESGTRLVELATEAGLDAKVPTCPAWDVRALLAHQAMVHRWATAHVRGDDPGALPAQTTLRKRDDLPEFYREGLGALLDALRTAPADLRAMRFLNDAPPPREFWARRQAHETTIHMVDALAAVVGAVPEAADARIGTELALDGVDELLCGFFTRGKSKLYDGTEYTFAVVPSDADRRWHVRVGHQLEVTDGDGTAEVTIDGTAAQLYLGLWNRGDELNVTGRPDLLDHWRATQRIGWS